MFTAKLFHAFRRQPYHRFNAAVDTTNNVFTRPAAPVIACIKSIEYSRHTCRAVKSAHQNVLIQVMQGLSRPDNINAVALMQGNADVPHYSVKTVTAAAV